MDQNQFQSVTLLQMYAISVALALLCVCIDKGSAVFAEWYVRVNPNRDMNVRNAWSNLILYRHRCGSRVTYYQVIRAVGMAVVPILNCGLICFKIAMFTQYLYCGIDNWLRQFDNYVIL